MAKNNRHNAAFVVGSVIGAVAGAAAALWKTPFTGEELRAKLTGQKSQAHDAAPLVASPQSGVTMSTRQGDRSIKDKVLSGVEKTLAPIVGVELGKTANGSSPTTGSDIKVNADYVGSTGSISNRKAWQGDTSADTSTSTAADGTPIIGLSRDRVDADKWAAAYTGETTVPTTKKTNTTTSTTPTATSTPTPAAAAPSTGPVASGDTPWSKTRRAWDSDSGSAQASTSTSSGGTPIIGLSQDRVDADKWAAAYSGEVQTPDTGATSFSGSDSGSTGSRSDSPASGSRSDSSASTGQGAKPAYPGNEETADHAAVDQSAPDSNVADVSQGGRQTPRAPYSSDEAASISQLTTPQTDRIPDSLRQPTERSTHPFPKLGGKE